MIIRAGFSRFTVIGWKGAPLEDQRSAPAGQAPPPALLDKKYKSRWSEGVDFTVFYYVLLVS